jgi:hypothetical protein
LAWLNVPISLSRRVKWSGCATAVTSAPITSARLPAPRIGGVTSRWPPTSNLKAARGVCLPFPDCYCSARHCRHPPATGNCLQPSAVRRTQVIGAPQRDALDSIDSHGNVRLRPNRADPSATRTTARFHGRRERSRLIPEAFFPLQRRFVASTWACVHVADVNCAPGVQTSLPD